MTRVFIVWDRNVYLGRVLAREGEEHAEAARCWPTVKTFTITPVTLANPSPASKKAQKAQKLKR